MAALEARVVASDQRAAAAAEANLAAATSTHQQSMDDLRQQVDARGSAEFSAIGTRVIGKPGKLNAKDAGEWRTWSFVMTAYCGAIKPRMQEMRERCIEGDETGSMNVHLTPMDRRLSQQLYYILVLLVEERFTQKLVAVGRGEGFLAWRRLSPTTSNQMLVDDTQGT